MENPLSKLALDYWYKVVVGLSAFVLVLTGSGLLPEFPTAPTALVSLGSFFVGLGEWINHPLQTRLLPYNAHFPGGVVSGHLRNNSPLGIVFIILGLALVVFGVYMLLS